VLGNSDLSQEDNTTRNVTIAVIAGDRGDVTPYAALSITFRFSDDNAIRWLILSEVEFCTDPGVQYYILINYPVELDYSPNSIQFHEVVQRPLRECCRKISLLLSLVLVS
jgi:hypothetical protein